MTICSAGLLKASCTDLDAHEHKVWERLKLVRFREAQAEDRAEPEDAGGRVALVAAGLAAVERLQRAAQQEDPRASQGQPSPPKRPFKTTSVPSLCALATRSTLQLMSGGRRCRMLLPV